MSKKSDKKNNSSTANDEIEKPPLEFVDVRLIKAICIGLIGYLFSFVLFSFLFGNAFGAFVAAPIAALSFFLIARWDRLRDSKEFNFNLKEFLRPLKIDVFTVLIGITIIFISQFIIGWIIGYFDIRDDAPASYHEEIHHLMDNFTIWMILMMVISFSLGGYVTASRALYYKLSPYWHAFVTSLSFTAVSFGVTIMIFKLQESNHEFFLADNEEAVGVKVVFLSIFPIVSLGGAKLAVLRRNRRLRSKPVKPVWDSDDLVQSEIKRFRTDSSVRSDGKITEADKKSGTRKRS